MNKTIKCCFKHGCYLDLTSDCLMLTYNTDDYDSDDEAMEAAIERMWPEVVAEVEGWIGLHGFEPGDLDEDFDGDENEYEEAAGLYAQEQTEIYIEPWDEEKHAPQCTYSGGLSVTEITI